MRKSIMKKVPFVLASVLCAFGLQACFVDSNDLVCRTEYSCGVECVDYCEPRTNGWYEWDECWETCDDVCHAYEVCENPPECYDDWDCGYGYSCWGGECFRDSNSHAGQQGNVGLCGSCNDSMDCSGRGSLCVELDTTKEHVCGTSCLRDEDCASGYQCNAYMDNNQSVGQCVPMTGSCRNNYCRDDYDCTNNASCEDHRCVFDKKLPNTNPNECTTYKDCAAYMANDGTPLNICINYEENGQKINYCTIDCYTDAGCDKGYYCYLEKADLDSGICFRGTEHACVYDKDCDGSMLCRNGKCTLSCNSDRDCVSGSNKFTCDNGACIFHE